MDSGMEFRRLRYFMRTAAEGSLGKASRALGVAQPALGRQIQLLEAELGLKLFQRVPRGMRLTEEGEYLKAALDHPLRQIDTALAGVRSHTSRVETSLTLGLAPAISRLLGAELHARLQAEVRNLRLHVVEGPAAKLAGDLVNGLVDIALIAGVTPDDRVFSAEVLREELRLTGAAASPLAAHGTVELVDLRDFPLIVPGPPDPLVPRLERFCASEGARFTVVSQVDSLEVTLAIVRRGGGYAILAPVHLGPEQGDGRLHQARIATGLFQTVYYAVQPHWRVSRTTYNAVERVIFESCRQAVSTGAWPGEWLFDETRLSTYAEPA